MGGANIWILFFAEHGSTDKAAALTSKQVTPHNAGWQLESSHIQCRKSAVAPPNRVEIELDWH